MQTVLSPDAAGAKCIFVLYCAVLWAKIARRRTRHDMVSSSTQDGIFILHLAGEININSLTETRSKVDALRLDQHPRIIVNLEKVSFFDSSGLGYLVVLIKQ